MLYLITKFFFNLVFSKIWNNLPPFHDVDKENSKLNLELLRSTIVPKICNKNFFTNGIKVRTSSVTLVKYLHFSLICNISCVVIVIGCRLSNTCFTVNRIEPKLCVFEADLGSSSFFLLANSLCSLLILYTLERTEQHSAISI